MTVTAARCPLHRTQSGHSAARATGRQRRCRALHVEGDRAIRRLAGWFGPNPAPLLLIERAGRLRDLGGPNDNSLSSRNGPSSRPSRSLTHNPLCASLCCSRTHEARHSTGSSLVAAVIALGRCGALLQDDRRKGGNLAASGGASTSPIEKRAAERRGKNQREHAEERDGSEHLPSARVVVKPENLRCRKSRQQTGRGLNPWQVARATVYVVAAPRSRHLRPSDDPEGHCEPPSRVFYARPECANGNNGGGSDREARTGERVDEQAPQAVRT